MYFFLQYAPLTLLVKREMFELFFRSRLFSTMSSKRFGQDWRSCVKRSKENNSLGAIVQDIETVVNMLSYVPVQWGL